MDVLSDVLDTVHLDSGMLFQNELAAPWGVRVPPREQLSFHVVTRGSAVLEVDGLSSPVSLVTGDIVVLAPLRGHALRDASESPCRSIEAMVADGSFRRPGDAGTSSGGVTTHLVCGWFRLSDARSEVLVSALPMVLRTGELAADVAPWVAQTVKLLGYEACAPRPGMTTVVTRLCDALFVYVLRSHLASLPHERPSWLRALVEPQIGEALQLMHADPGAAWTVGKLAAGVRMSRSAFSAQFSKVVGEPPMQYLTHWRLLKACSMLRGGTLDISAIAQQTGYGSAAAFSKAFARIHGVSPGVYRRRQITGASGQVAAGRG